MEKAFQFLLLFLTFSTVLIAGDLFEHFAGKYFLFSYREGGPVYGTYYFHHTHHCRDGQYIEYVYTNKKSVLGSMDHQNSWRSYGSWRVTTQNGVSGIMYEENDGTADFVPLQLLPDGTVLTRDGLSIVYQGSAECY